MNELKEIPDHLKEVKIGYMCQIDFEYELGNARDGNKVYPSVKNLLENHNSNCGIVEVEIKVKSVVKEHND